VVGAALGAGILFVTIPLISKDEGDELSGEEEGIGMIKDAASVVTEYDPAEAYDFGATWGWCPGEGAEEEFLFHWG
jgi:hypothetical protein